MGVAPNYTGESMINKAGITASVGANQSSDVGSVEWAGGTGAFILGHQVASGSGRYRATFRTQPFRTGEQIFGTSPNLPPTEVDPGFSAFITITFDLPPCIIYVNVEELDGVNPALIRITASNIL